MWLQYTRYAGVHRLGMYAFLKYVLLPVVFGPLFRYRVTGRGRVPKTGPVLILPNHTSALDPWWVGYHAQRPAWYMASSQLFRMKALGWFISLQGAFPKQKFVRDQAAIDKVHELIAHDQVVVLFPEGSRTFDGRNEHVRAGIGGFIRELGYPTVVFCRIQSGHLWRPRWAKRARWLPLHLEYSEPFDFSGLHDDQIVEVVREQIRIDGDRFVEEGFDAPVWGRRIADGLDAYVWACPHCLESERFGVTADGSGVACGGCGADWELKLTNELVPRGGPAGPLTVSQAFDRLQARYGTPPVFDRAEFERMGTVLSGQGRVGRVGDTTETELVAEGLVRLTPEALAVFDGDDEIWRLPLAELRAASLEIGNILQLRRLSGELFQLDPLDRSTLVWAHFITPWNRKARGKPI